MGNYILCNADSFPWTRPEVFDNINMNNMIKYKFIDNNISSEYLWYIALLIFVNMLLVCLSYA